MTITELREFEEATVVLYLSDGEVLRARISFVDLEYEDIIVDVLQTNRPEHYKNPKASYTVRASDIASVDKVQNSVDPS